MENKRFLRFLGMIILLAILKSSFALSETLRNDQFEMIYTDIEGKIHTVILYGATIAEGQFSHNEDMIEIVIPEGITVIQGEAFWGCEKLRKVSFPSTLIAIESSAFQQCSHLQQIEFCEGLVCIGRCAFAETGLTSVSLPQSLQWLGDEVFAKSPLERLDIHSCYFEYCSLLFAYTSSDYLEIHVPSLEYFDDFIFDLHFDDTVCHLIEEPSWDLD